MSIRTVLGARLAIRFAIVGASILAMVSCQNGGPSLQIDRRELRVGQSARLHPVGFREPVTYFTSEEHSAVVEPDGVVTAIGFDGERDTVVITAAAGRTRNTYRSASVSIHLRPDGNAASLVMTTNHDEPGPGRFACCPNPAFAVQGSTLRFRVRQAGTRRDVTRDGTKYVRFFGSGVPDDPDPRRVIGPMYSRLSAKTFTISAKTATIQIPKIGADRQRDVIIFFRNRNNVGWKSVTITQSVK